MATRKPGKAKNEATTANLGRLAVQREVVTDARTPRPTIPSLSEAEGTGVARVVANAVRDDDEYPLLLILLLKLDQWRVVPIEMFGYMKFENFDDESDEEVKEFLPFRLVPNEPDYKADFYSQIPPSADDEYATITRIFDVKIAKGARFTLVQYDDESDETWDTVMEIESIHFV